MLVFGYQDIRRENCRDEKKKVNQRLRLRLLIGSRSLGVSVLTTRIKSGQVWRQPNNNYQRTLVVWNTETRCDPTGGREDCEKEAGVDVRK